MEQRVSQMVPLLLWLLALHLIGLLIFTKGFLLTRVELELYSSCSDFPLRGQSNERTTDGPACRRNGYSHHPETSSDPTSKGPSLEGSDASPLEEFCSIVHDKSGNYSQKCFRSSKCWTTPKVQKVVIVIIDAMRFDFAANVSEYHQPRGAWVGRLPIFERLVAEKEASAALFKFVADPPTTSLQRLKGLTTGGLPTFIDIGNSFGAPAITEDNIISQLAQQGRRLVLLGDDTWMDLYPTQFTEAHPYPSFVVKDIHTVDNGVIKEIFPALEHDDWDVLIGHFLGVDHVGHTYDVSSQVMLDKLDHMSAVLEDIVAALQAHSQGLHRDTLLIVMGDHAQTLSGDHGGGTPEETDTALFALSMRPPPAPLPSCMRSPPCSSSSLEEGPLRCSRLPQVDFAPTLAMLLGVPIPYASVGKISPELWALCANTWADCSPTADDDSSFPPCLEANCGNTSGKEGGSTADARNDCGNAAGSCALAEDGQSGSSGKNQSLDSGDADGGCQCGESVEPAAGADEEGEKRAGNEAPLSRWMEGYLAALQVNSAQVQRYLDRYSAAAASPFPAAALGKVRALHRNAVSARDEARVLLEGEKGWGSGKGDAGTESGTGEEQASGQEAESWEQSGSSGSCQTREAAICTSGQEEGTRKGATGRSEPGCRIRKERISGKVADCMEQSGASQSPQTRKPAIRNATRGEERGERGREATGRAIGAHLAHLAAAAELARAQWTQFDGAAMVLGLTILVASLIAHFAALISLSSPSPPPWPRVLTSAASLGACLGLAAYLVRPAVEGRDLHRLERALRSGSGDGVKALVVGSGAASLTSVAVLVRHVLRAHVPFNLTAEGGTTAARSRTKDWGVLLFTCGRAASLISDNCIMAEGGIAVALATLIAALYLRDAIGAGDRARIRDALLLIAANASLGYLGLQSVSSQRGGQTGEVLAPPLAALSTTVPLVLLFYLLLRQLPKGTGFWRGFKLCCALQYALVCCYRVAEDLGDHFLPPAPLRVARTFAPRAVYGLAAVLVSGLVMSVFDLPFRKRRPRLSDTPAEKKGATKADRTGVNGAAESSSDIGLVQSTGRAANGRNEENGLGISAPEAGLAKGDPGLGDPEQSSLGSTVALATSARVVALVTVLAGVLVMLLGSKGPAVLFAAAVQLACSIRLQSLYSEPALGVSKPESALTQGSGSQSVPAAVAASGPDAIRSESENIKRVRVKKERSGNGQNGAQISVKSHSAALKQSGASESEEDSSGFSSEKSAHVDSRANSAKNFKPEAFSSSSDGLVSSTALGPEWSLYTTQLFFCTGHRCAFDALQYTAAFVGFEGFSFVQSGTLLAANTFAAHILVAFALPLLVCFSATKGQGARGLRVQLGRVVLGYGLACTLAFIVTVGTVAVLRRHLMVWSIFAPKFVFDSCSLLVTDVLLVFVAVYVEAAFGRLSDKKC